MNKLLLFITVLTINLISINAQDSAEEGVFVPNIYAVKAHPIGQEYGFPLISLQRGKLKVSFDDFSEDEIRYKYKVQYFNSDWSPSDLDEMDYLDGFSENYIDDYQFSYNTDWEYTNFNLMLPNDDIQFLVSGNYLLSVYDEDDMENPVFSRRFMVYESRVKINTEIRRSSDLSLLKTHQEVNFVIDYKGFSINNAAQEVKVHVLQNGDWSKRQVFERPLFLQQERLIYEKSDQNQFAGGREFRYFDFRNINMKTENVAEIKKDRDATKVYLFADKNRYFENYIYRKDINGGFVIGQQDADDNAVESDYAFVYFHLDESWIPDTKITLEGQLNNSYFKDNLEVKYLMDRNVYVGAIFLKQGYYNYRYEVIDESGMDKDRLEGNSFQTENNYQILVYYRPFGNQSDRLIGIDQKNTLF